jgi:hypothetical protein
LAIDGKVDLLDKIGAQKARGEVALDWLVRYVDVPVLANLEGLDTEP